MAFTPVATTDTLETFRTRYNATPLTIVDDSSTSVDITLATDSLKLSGGTGIASAISGDTVTFNLSNTGVSAATYGSATAIPVIAINAQGQITSASTASVSSDLTIVDDSSTSTTVSLGTDTLKISGGTGTTSAISGDTVTINLDNTAVSAGDYGSSSAIPIISVDAQGRITGVTTAAASSDLTIVDDSSTSEVITLGTETLKFAGGTGISTAITSGTVTISKSSTAAYIDYIYTATSGQTTFSGADDNTNTLSYAAANLDVFLNGVLLDDSDYTATNTTSIVLTSGAAASDILTAKAWEVDNVSSFDVNGSEFVLDVDGDTSITADTDDQIDFKVGGTDRVVISTQSIKVPTGSTGDRDGTPATGMLRFNTTTPGFEGYNGTEWGAIGGGGGTDWQAVKTSDFTAAAGEGYFIDTSSGAVTMTLPASPSIGDEVAFKDYGKTFDTNNLTVNRNSENIEGDASNMTVSLESAGNTLVYVDSTKGWLIKTV